MKKIIASMFFLIIASHSYGGINFARNSSITNWCNATTALGIQDGPEAVRGVPIAYRGFVHPEGNVVYIKWLVQNSAQYTGRTAQVKSATQHKTSDHEVCTFENCSVVGKGPNDSNPVVTATVDCTSFVPNKKTRIRMSGNLLP